MKKVRCQCRGVVDRVPAFRPGRPGTIPGRVRNFNLILGLNNTWDRKVLRTMFGAVCINNEWRVRTNAELEELYKVPKIVADIRAHRL